MRACDVHRWQFPDVIYVFLCGQGFLPKEAVRAQFDGTLFYQLARKNEVKKAAAKRDQSKVSIPRGVVLSLAAIILIGVVVGRMMSKYE